jgi:hypothetical protein
LVAEDVVDRWKSGESEELTVNGNEHVPLRM